MYPIWSITCEILDVQIQIKHTSAKCCTPIVVELFNAATSHLYENTLSLKLDIVCASIRRGATIARSPAMDS